MVNGTIKSSPNVQLNFGQILRKIESVPKKRKIVDEEYFIERLNDFKPREMLESIGEDIGLIV